MAAPYSVRDYSTVLRVRASPRSGQGAWQGSGQAPIPLAMSPATPGQQQAATGGASEHQLRVGWAGTRAVQTLAPRALAASGARGFEARATAQRSGSRTQSRAQLGMASVAVAQRSDDRPNVCQVARGRRLAAATAPMYVVVSDASLRVALGLCGGTGEETDGGPGGGPGGGPDRGPWGRARASGHDSWRARAQAHGKRTCACMASSGLVGSRRDAACFSRQPRKDDEGANAVRDDMTISPGAKPFKAREDDKPGL
ncbi:hypothetical protein V8C35DRAFT_333317 [Trichoderma chlorosporum]